MCDEDCVCARDAGGQLHYLQSSKSVETEPSHASAHHEWDFAVRGSEVTKLKVENVELKHYALQLESQLHMMLVRKVETEDMLRRRIAALEDEVERLRRDEADVQIVPEGAEVPVGHRCQSCEALAQQLLSENSQLREMLNMKCELLTRGVPGAQGATRSLADLLPSDADAFVASQQGEDYKDAVQTLNKLVCKLHSNAEKFASDPFAEDAWISFWKKNVEFFATHGLDLRTVCDIMPVKPLTPPTTDRGTITDQTSCLTVDATSSTTHRPSSASLSSEETSVVATMSSPERRRASNVRAPKLISAKHHSHGHLNNQNVRDELECVRAARYSTESEVRSLTLQLYSGGVVPRRVTSHSVSTAKSSHFSSPEA